VIWLALLGAALGGFGLGGVHECYRWMRRARRHDPRMVIGGRTYWVSESDRPCARCGCAVLRRNCACCLPSGRVARERVAKVVRRHSA
jgi:hypothetical protein